MEPSHVPIEHRWFLDDPPESSQSLVRTSVVIARDKLPLNTTGSLHRLAEHRFQVIGPSDCRMEQIPEDHKPLDPHFMDLRLQTLQGRLGSPRGDG